MKIDTKERLASAQWIFERTLGWVAAAEVKVAAISAIDTAMLAALGALFITESEKSAWANLFGAITLISLFFGILCAALVLIPRMARGPAHSMLYFGKIASLTEAEYEQRLRNSSDDQLLTDWAAQIHFNAKIAQKKHEWVQKCLYWSLFGALWWLGAVFAALSHHSS